MGGGRSSSGDVTKTKRYAPYIEAHHSSLLSITATQRDIAIADSPYANYEDVEISAAFFGIGYVISNFPSLYDMFGSHMAGLDIETLWDSTFSNVVSSSKIDEAVAIEMSLADDGIVKGELANFQLDMRNLNAVATSSFVLGKAVVEDKRIKAFARMSLDVKADLFVVAGKEYASHLNWEKRTVVIYAEIIKGYLLLKPEIDDINYTFDSRNALWPFKVLSFEGAVLGTMQTVGVWQKQMSPRKRSDLSTGLSVASYTVSGAYIGSSFPPYGTAIGAVIGFIVGVAMMLLE